MFSKKSAGLALAFAALAAIGSSASAQGLYVGASGGMSKFDVDCTGTSQCDKSDSAYKVFGGYQINDGFAVEAAYVSVGKTDASVDLTPGLRASLDTKVTGFDVAGVVRAPFGSQWHGFAKLGLTSYEAKSNLRVNNAFYGSDKDDGWKPLFGLGVSYAVSKQLGVRAEWESRRIEVLSENMTINTFTVGVHYAF